MIGPFACQVYKHFSSSKGPWCILPHLPPRSVPVEGMRNLPAQRCRRQGCSGSHGGSTARAPPKLPEPLHANKPSCSSPWPSASLAVSSRVTPQIRPSVSVASLFCLSLFKPLSLFFVLPFPPPYHRLCCLVLSFPQSQVGDWALPAQGQAWCWAGGGRVLGTPGPHQGGQLHFGSWLATS